MPRLNSNQAESKFSIEITPLKILWLLRSPPPDGVNASVVHKIAELYKTIYLNSKKLNKGDKLGIRAKTEQICSNCLRLSIEAALLCKDEKMPIVKKLKNQIELLKQFARLEMELKIIDEKVYISWQTSLQEISKMANGWLIYLQKRNLI
ncbi:MAG: four helix bundle protein [Candidatus Magasanikbacteria bacterium]|nr:four helix bundle protein [Candidatus Magasanikbacteria bacterium]